MFPNRAVAVSQVRGPEAGMETIQAMPNSQVLDSYYLLYAVLGEFELQLNNLTAAAEHLRRALQLTKVKSEQELLLKRLQQCENQGGKNPMDGVTDDLN